MSKVERRHRVMITLIPFLLAAYLQLQVAWVYTIKLALLATYNLLLDCIPKSSINKLCYNSFT